MAALLEEFAKHALRYSLVLVLLWIGATKFTSVEAEAIRGLVASSPLLGWLYAVLSVQRTSALIGCAELVIAVLIAIRPLSARLAMAGSTLVLTTLSFMLSTPS